MTIITMVGGSTYVLIIIIIYLFNSGRKSVFHCESVTPSHCHYKVDTYLVEWSRRRMCHLALNSLYSVHKYEMACGMTHSP